MTDSTPLVVEREVAAAVKDPQASEPVAFAGVVRGEVPRAARYGVVGVANVAIDFTLYAALVTFGLWYPVAKAISLTVATINGYHINRRWTFRAGPHQHALLARYSAVQVVCYFTNVALLLALVEFASLHEIAAQLVAIPVVAAVSFLAQRLWTFGSVTR